MKMRLQHTWVHLLLFGAVFVHHTESRRIRVQRPLPEEEQQESIQYYAAEPREEEQRQVVLVSSADQYNGYYGQPTAASRRDEDNYIPRGSVKSSGIASRVKESTRPPPVQTIRNYNKVNDDGSFTFGYEAADGSFKEETRGTDCVVRGKYGYVDPDGNKREFTYVSGNPCDPNAPKDEEDLPDETESNENENIPANYPTRPIRPRPIPITPKPVTLYQNTYDQSEDVQPEPEQLLRATPTPSRRPQYISRPQYQYQQAEAAEQQTYQRPQVVSSSTPASVLYRQSPQPVSITPRPHTVSPTPTSARSQLPATTYRPQLLQVAVTPRPALHYTKGYSSTLAPTKNVDFDSEFQRYQTQNNVVSPTPSTLTKTTPKPNGQVYSSALVYDPASGQYKTQLYQSLPQTEGDFSFNHRIQPYVHTPQRTPQVLNIQQLQQSQQPLYTQSLRPQVAPQAVYQAQQAETQFQNSAQLYAQQQKARSQQARPQQQLRQQAQAPVYYVQPSVDAAGALGASQIDAFLRGHNIQF